jgi:metallo-beta-lactamase class B
MFRIVLFLFIQGFFSSCNGPNLETSARTNILLELPNLEIEKISPHTFVHRSFLETTSFGTVVCNGMIVVNKGQAIILDSPIHQQDAMDLLHFIKHNLRAEVKGIVVNHFHDDCLGALDYFHKMGISSYANSKTVVLAAAAGLTLPQEQFSDSLLLQLGSLEIVNHFLGVGHTQDNIVTYIPQDQVLFGGCLVKCLGATKGYLGDADTEAWPSTIQKVKKKFGDAKIVVPGHGAIGKLDLLDYTFDLFRQGTQDQQD